MKLKIILLLYIQLSAFGMNMYVAPANVFFHGDDDGCYGERLANAIMRDDQNVVKTLCTMTGSAWKVEYLLSTDKLNANLQSAQGHALIHWVTRGNNPDILEVLLKDPRTDRDIQNKNGCTALGFAVAQGKVLPTQLLLQYNANPNIINESKEQQGDHHSLLHSAIMGYSSMGISYRVGYFTIIKLLLANPKTFVNRQDITGKTPLHYVVLLGNIALVNLLLCCNRIDQKVKDNDNKTALDYANETNKHRMVKLLSNY